MWFHLPNARHANAAADQSQGCAYLRQAQAGALLALGREKRIKDPLQRFRRHSVTTVLGTNPDVSTKRGRSVGRGPRFPSHRTDLNFAAMGDRVSGAHEG
jgi:hypothetical protein